MGDTSAIRDVLSRPCRDSPLVVFTLATFAFSWTVWAGATAAFESSRQDLFLTLAVLGPAFGALIALSRTGESVSDWVRRRVFRVPSARWVLVIVLTAFGIEFVRVGLQVMVPPVGISGTLPPDIPSFWNRLARLVLLLSFLAGFEEFGWRGYALPHLQERYGALGGSVILGVLWGVWHVPAYVIATQLVLIFAGFLVTTVAFSVVITWVFNGSGGMVWSAFLLHGLHNVAIGVIGSLSQKGITVYYLAGLGAMALAGSYPLYRYGQGTLSPAGIVTPNDGE